MDTGGSMGMLYLAAGGVLGTLARYAMGNWIQLRAGASFPWGTLAVNLLGSLLLGLGYRLGTDLQLAPEVRLFLTAGFCGAFTTFSTFSYEALGLLQRGSWERAAVYSLTSLVLGIAAVLAGFELAGLVVSNVRR